MTALALLVPYVFYCAVMTGTPGPNNMMALASGVRVGVLRSLPLVLGISVGVALQLAAVAFGLGTLFTTMPWLHTVLQIAGASFLVYIAWKIAMSGPLKRSEEADIRPLGFFGAAVFQWLNPKAWAMTMSAVAAYIPQPVASLDVAIACAVMAGVAIPLVSLWAAGGSLLRRWLMRPGVARVFNGAMAVLLLASTLPILFDNARG